MTAPTLAAIVEAVSDAVEDQLATNCYQGEDHGDGSCECPTAGDQELIVNVAITETLRALEPLVSELETDAKDFDRDADSAFADGGREIAANVWRAQAHSSGQHAKQLRALMPATTGEKS